MRKKVTVVGAGNVGATTAQRLYERGYMDVVLVDVVEDMPQGKALDIMESGPVLGVDAVITGSNTYDATANSDAVVITAGIARKPGMSRDDLLFTNMKIVGSVVEQIVKYSPNTTIVVVSNPLDAMVQHAYTVAKFPKNRVVGMAGVLDTARFRTFLAQELKVSVKDVQAYVLGGHGDQMVPLTHYTTIGGVPISELLSKEALDRIIKRTQGGGGEIVALLKTGSAFYAPSAASAEMVDAILLDQKRQLPCAALLEGEYGISGIYMGVPVILGAGGVEKVIELKLTDEESQLLKQSADEVHKLVEVMANAPKE
ncbi:MAG: malate dehydrogenase [Dehalococcoidia bacterium]